MQTSTCIRKKGICQMSAGSHDSYQDVASPRPGRRLDAMEVSNRQMLYVWQSIKLFIQQCTNKTLKKQPSEFRNRSIHMHKCIKNHMWSSNQIAAHSYLHLPTTICIAELEFPKNVAAVYFLFISVQSCHLKWSRSNFYYRYYICILTQPAYALYSGWKIYSQYKNTWKPVISVDRRKLRFWPDSQFCIASISIQICGNTLVMDGNRSI